MSPSLSLQEIIEELSLTNPFNGVCNLEEPPRPSCNIVPQELSLLAKISYVQEQINLLTYNFLPRTFFSLQKHRSLQSILLTAKQILTEALPIRCLEATFVGLYLTQNLNSIDRIPISFKSRANDKIYRHIILAVHLRQQHTGYGAIGLSRKANLMYKAPEFHSLYDLIMDYKKEYELLGHELIDIKLGLSVTHNSYCSLHPCWRFVSLTLKRFARQPQESHHLHLHSREHHEHLEQHSRELSSHNRNLQNQLHRQSLPNKDKQNINKLGHHDKKNVNCSAKVLNVHEASSVPIKALSLSEPTTTHSSNVKHSRCDTNIVSDNDDSNKERGNNFQYVNKTVNASQREVLLLPSNKHFSSSAGVSIDKYIGATKLVSYAANETVNEERESAPSRGTRHSHPNNCHDYNNVSAASKNLLEYEWENVKNINRDKNAHLSTLKVSTQRFNMQAQKEKYDDNNDDFVNDSSDNNNNFTEMEKNEQLIKKHEELDHKNVFADPQAKTDSVICNSILKPFHKNDKAAAEHLLNNERRTLVTSQFSNTTSASTSPYANTASLLSEIPQKLIEEEIKQITKIRCKEEQKECDNNCQHNEYDALKQFLDKYCQLLSTMSHQYYHRENMSTSSILTHAAKLNLTARAAQLPFLDLDKAEHDRKSENHRRITHILQLQSPFSAEAMTVNTRQYSTTTSTSQVDKETCMPSASSTLSKKVNVRAREHFDSIKSRIANKESAQHQTLSSSSSSSTSSTSSSSSSPSLSSSSVSTHSLPSPSYNVSSKADATPITTCNNTKTEKVQYIDSTL